MHTSDFISACIKTKMMGLLRLHRMGGVTHWVLSVISELLSSYCPHNYTKNLVKWSNKQVRPTGSHKPCVG